jgi:hypothetical protein
LRVEKGNARRFALNTQLTTISSFCGQLLRQEKDEASLLRVCGQDSLSAFILCFAGMKAFLFSAFSFSSSSPLFDFKAGFRDENEDEKRERLPPALVSQSPTRFANCFAEYN